MSSCNKISQLLSAYVDDEISASEKEMVEKHIENCTSCKQKLEVMIKTKNILKATPQIPVPETLLKDFDEYRKKSEQTEKKVVPFYKNYRVYASVAAIFIFAFVLKSGLWQEDKYMPNSLTQTKVTEQSIDAPIENGNASENTDISDSETIEKPVVEKDVTNNPPKQKKVAEPTKTVEVNTVTPQPEPAQQVITKKAVIPADEPQAEPVYDESGATPTDEVHAIEEPQSATMSRIRNAPEEEFTAEETEVPAHAIVYVSKEHLAKAAKLLSEGEYFYAQVEQKLSDNRIPFESNYLVLDESVPHKVVVMVKE